MITTDNDFIIFIANMSLFISGTLIPLGVYLGFKRNKAWVICLGNCVITALIHGIWIHFVNQ